MRIMFIVPRLSGGGAEKVIASLASCLSEKHEVFLLTTIMKDGNEEYPLSENVKLISLHERMYPQLYGKSRSEEDGRFKKILKKIAFKILPVSLINKKRKLSANPQAEALKKIKQELQIDCAVSFLNSANYLNVLSKAGEKTIVSIRSYLSGPFAPAEVRRPGGREQIIETCQKADRIVAVSEETADDLIRTFGVEPEKISVISNYCDQEHIRKLSEEPEENGELIKKIDKAGFVFFSSGRLTAKKGQWHMIRAFREVVRKHPNALLVILGREGKNGENTKPLLEKIIAENGLQDSVLLPGFCSNPYTYLKHGDAFVLSSFNEGFPNALIEAMALGLPVISTDCSSGPREILAPRTDCSVKTEGTEYAEYGILISEPSGNTLILEPAEPAEILLAGAMNELIEKPELREHYASSTGDCLIRYTKEKILASWEETIECIL